jgi:hypothetical protein
MAKNAKIAECIGSIAWHSQQKIQNIDKSMR